MVRLLCVRLADQQVTHPDQITARCHRCLHQVGIFPSGQLILRQHPDAEIVCAVCRPPDPSGPTPPPAARSADEFFRELREAQEHSRR